MSEGPAQKKVKKPAKPADHPKYTDMVKAAVAALKERNGSSRQAIEKYIKANYKVGENCRSHLKLALKRMSDKETLLHTKGKGASGSFKLNKSLADAEKKPKKKVIKKPVAKKAAVKKPAAKKAAAKKATAKASAKKVASPKKVSSPKKKTAAKKAVKKPAAKAKVAAKKPAAKKGKKPSAKKPAAKGKGMKAAKSPKK